MKVFLLFALDFACALGSKGCSKDISVMMAGRGKAGRPLYLMLNGVLACLFFLFSSRFCIAVNGTNLGYSAVYSLLVIVALTVALYIYRYFSVATVGVITSAGSLILSSLCGFLGWHEAVTLPVLVRIALMVCALVLVYASTRKADVAAGCPAADTPAEKCPTAVPPTVGKANRPGAKKVFGKGAVLIGVQLVNTVLVTVVSKLYGATPAAEQSSSMFFLVNVFLVLFALGQLGVLYIKDKAGTAGEIRAFRPRVMGAILGNCVSSNISSLVSVALLQLVAVSVASPISSALGILSGVVISLLRKEKLNGYLFAAVAVSVLAIIIITII